MTYLETMRKIIRGIFAFGFGVWMLLSGVFIFVNLFQHIFNDIF